MSDTIDQLREDLRLAIDVAVASVPPEERVKFAKALERAGQHLAAGKMKLAQVDLLTVETLLFIEGNERAKSIRNAVFTALMKAAVNGIVLV